MRKFSKLFKNVKEKDFVQGADAARKGYEDVAQSKAMAEKLLAE